jgi:hypothetical protein
VCSFVACGGDEVPPPLPASPGIIAGLSVDAPLVDAIDQLEIHLEVPIGTVVLDEQRLRADGSLVLPAEVPIARLAEPRRVHLRLTARRADGSELVSRVFETSSVADGDTRLLRARLHDECAAIDGRSAVDCGANQSCIAGLCRPPSIGADRLEPYRDDWSEPYSDDCVPPDPGAPAVEVGAGGELYQPLAADTPLVPVAGIQGGHHVDLDIRADNLHSEGVTVLMRGTFPEAALFGTVQQASQNLLARNGTCDVRNVRYVLPSPDAFLTTMRLYLAVVDHTGNAGATEVEVPILEPSGDPPVP